MGSRESPEPDAAPTERLPATEEEYGYVEPAVEETEVIERRPGRRPPTLWPYLLFLLLLVLGGLGALWYFTREDEPDLKPVPGVVRLPEGDAVQRLDEEGFESEIMRRPSDEAEQGIVFAQQPEAGSELEEGSTVTLLVASGPATTEVPDVTGLPADRAEEQLRDAGFEVSRAEVFSDKEQGTVVAQEPAGNERAPLESSVRINVSKGTANVEVPDVVGRTASEAGSILREAGLGTPNVVRVPSAEPRDQVVAQNPAAGSQAPRGSAIRINVSQGTGATPEPAGVEVPDVEGLTEDEAVAALEDAGLTARVERETTDDPTLVGTVLRQQPGAGTTASNGDEVAIFVGE
jgi:eukaryotic-like serine/threonine-protein kinase